MGDEWRREAGSRPSRQQPVSTSALRAQHPRGRLRLRSGADPGAHQMPARRHELRLDHVRRPRSTTRQWRGRIRRTERQHVDGVLRLSHPSSLVGPERAHRQGQCARRRVKRPRVVSPEKSIGELLGACIAVVHTWEHVARTHHHDDAVLTHERIDRCSQRRRPGRQVRAPRVSQREVHDARPCSDGGLECPDPLVLPALVIREVRVVIQNSHAQRSTSKPHRCPALSDHAFERAAPARLAHLPCRRGTSTGEPGSTSAPGAAFVATGYSSRGSARCRVRSGV